MRAVLAATEETIVVLDRQGIVLTANRIVCERVGIKKKDFIGRCIYDFFPPEVSKSRRMRKTVHKPGRIELFDE